MELEPAEFALPHSSWQAPFIDEAIDERHPAQLREQRGIEVDLVHPADDLALARRHLAALTRIDLDDQHVLGRGRAQERNDGGIAAVTAVPRGYAVDLHRAEKMRNRGRGHHHLRRDLRAREN